MWCCEVNQYGLRLSRWILCRPSNWCVSQPTAASLADSAASRTRRRVSPLAWHLAALCANWCQCWLFCFSGGFISNSLIWRRALRPLIRLPLFKTLDPPLVRLRTHRTRVCLINYTDRAVGRINYGLSRRHLHKTAASTANQSQVTDGSHLSTFTCGTCYCLTLLTSRCNPPVLNILEDITCGTE